MTTSNMFPLKDFEFVKVLNEDTRSKTLCILGTLPLPTSTSNEEEEKQRDHAILFLEKQPFDTPTISNETETVSNPNNLSNFNILQQNDIYTWFLASGAVSSLNGLKGQVIFPATNTHIMKYSVQQKVLITETPRVYSEIVEHFIKSQPESRIQWVYNILAKQKESETIIFEDPDPVNGFILLPDSKWDGKTVDTFYFQAIVHNKSLKSVRDLRVANGHLDMLKSLKENILNVVPEYFLQKNGATIRRDQIRLYVHYQPSYYHFHVHVTHLQYEYPGQLVGQAHLLDDIIDAMELFFGEGKEFMEMKTFTYSLGKNHELFKAFVAAGIVDG